MERNKCCRSETIFLILVLVAVVSGAVLGVWLNPALEESSLELHHDILLYIELPGLLFLRMMKMLVIPLAMCANIDSFSCIKVAQSGRIGRVTLTSFMMFTFLGSCIGAGMALLFTYAYDEESLNQHVQSWADASNITSKTSTADVHVTIVGIALNLIPANLFEAGFRQSRVTRHEDTNIIQFSNQDSSGANLIGVLIFSMIFGIVTGYLRPATDAVADFFHGCRLVLTRICMLMIWTFPLAVFSMVAHHISQTADLVETVTTLVIFVVCNIIATLLFLVIALVIFSYTTRMFPSVILRDMVPSMVCALATASSAATIPMTHTCLMKKDYANAAVVRFVLPLGCTLNMSGTCIFQAASALFLLQCSGSAIDIHHVLICIFCAIVASAITGALPSGSLMSILLTLDALKIPIEFVELLLPIDWLLDRIRSPANVLISGIDVVIISKILDRDKTRSNQVHPVIS